MLPLVASGRMTLVYRLVAAAAGPIVFHAGSFSPALPAAVVGLMALVVLDGGGNGDGGLDVALADYANGLVLLYSEESAPLASISTSPGPGGRTTCSRSPRFPGPGQ